MTDPLRATASPPDQPLEPQPPKLLRWALVGVALLILALVGYKAAHWFADDGAPADADQVKTQAEARTTPPSPSTQTESAGPAPTAPAVVGRTVRPPQPSAPPARATAPGDAINKCVVDGQVTYTNGACPEGAVASRVDASSTNPAVAPGFAAGALEPVALAGADPSQQDAECRFLTAEITRLDYEFKQLLPPPVLDQISGRLRERRDRAAALKCAPVKAADVAEKKPAPPKPKPRPKPVVVEEKAGD